jgi:hypothetical protein
MTAPTTPGRYGPQRTTLFGLGVIDGRQSAEEVRCLTEEEVRQYRDDVTALWRFDRARELASVVMANAAAFATTTREVESLPYAEARKIPTREFWTREVNRRLVNFLTSFRLYVDHNEARLHRMYGGRHAPQFKAFRKAASRAYDSSSAYRVLSNARNFVQHVGMIIQALPYDESTDPATGRITHTVQVNAAREYLLRNFDDWRHAEADLRAIPESFPIAPLVAEVASLILTIGQEYPEGERAFLTEAAERVVALVSSVPAQYRVGVVLELIPRDPLSPRIVLLPPPERTLRWLGVPCDRVALPGVTGDLIAMIRGTGLGEEL